MTPSDQEPVPEITPEPTQRPATIHIELPQHLANLANVPRHIYLPVPTPITQHTILDTLEAHYPMLRGTIRDHSTHLRRPFLRFFACQQDISHLSPDDPLPNPVAEGCEPFLIIGSISGG